MAQEVPGDPGRVRRSKDLAELRIDRVVEHVARAKVDGRGTKQDETARPAPPEV
jgi:hypothetical protein